MAILLVLHPNKKAIFPLNKTRLYLFRLFMRIEEQKFILSCLTFVNSFRKISFKHIVQLILNISFFKLEMVEKVKYEIGLHSCDEQNGWLFLPTLAPTNLLRLWTNWEIRRNIIADSTNWAYVLTSLSIAGVFHAYCMQLSGFMSKARREPGFNISLFTE